MEKRNEDSTSFNVTGLEGAEEYISYIIHYTKPQNPRTPEPHYLRIDDTISHIFLRGRSPKMAQVETPHRLEVREPHSCSERGMNEW